MSSSLLSVQRFGARRQMVESGEYIRESKRLCLSREQFELEDRNLLQQLITKSFTLLHSECSEELQDLTVAIS